MRMLFARFMLHFSCAGLCSTVGQTQEPEVQGSVPGVSHILSFLFPLMQEGQLSVTGESMCMKYWLTD